MMLLLLLLLVLALSNILGLLLTGCKVSRV